MHRDVVTHVAVSSADFFITGSVDGEQGQRLCIIRVFFSFESSPVVRIIVF